jgi:hypothetical protein
MLMKAQGNGETENQVNANKEMRHKGHSKEIKEKQGTGVKSKVIHERN